jgi:hypothetical protein
VSAVTVELPEVAYYHLDRRPVFISAVCEVQARVGERLVDVWPDDDTVAEHDLHFAAAEARSLAAALLAAADASEATE